jgi:hypothetical protein
MTTQNSYPALGFSSGYFYRVDGDTQANRRLLNHAAGSFIHLHAARPSRTIHGQAHSWSSEGRHYFNI